MERTIPVGFLPERWSLTRIPLDTWPVPPGAMAVAPPATPEPEGNLQGGSQWRPGLPCSCSMFQEEFENCVTQYMKAISFAKGEPRWVVGLAFPTGPV